MSCTCRENDSLRMRIDMQKNLLDMLEKIDFQKSMISLIDKFNKLDEIIDKHESSIDTELINALKELMKL